MYTRALMPVLLLTSVVLAGCATTEQAAPTPQVPAVVGDWNYSVDTPDGIYRGTLTLLDQDGALGGTLTSSGQTFTLEDVTYDGSELTFVIPDSPYGRISAEAELGEDALSGRMEVGSYGNFPLTAERAMD